MNPLTQFKKIPILPLLIALALAFGAAAGAAPDYVLQNTSTRQTAIWYLNNNVFVSAVFGPTIPAGWSLVAP